jgi:hypothetical protein
MHLQVDISSRFFHAVVVSSQECPPASTVGDASRFLRSAVRPIPEECSERLGDPLLVRNNSLGTLESLNVDVEQRGINCSHGLTKGLTKRIWQAWLHDRTRNCLATVVAG